jgi:serine protease
MSAISKAIRYAADNGARIINCSFGTFPGASISQVPSLVDAVAYAAGKGALVVAAAGNDSRDIDASPTFPASLPEPAVVSVGASANNDTKASFSNWGATSVDLFAPGWSVLSTIPGGNYGSLHGTSMAAPYVAAAAALAFDAEPGLNALDVKNLLMTASTPVDAFVGKSVSGERLDAGRALNPSEAPSDDVAFTFTGFSGPVAGQPVSASVSAAVVPAVVPSGSQVAYRATLLTNSGGTAYGVSGAEVTTDQGTVVTGDDASVELSPAGGYPSESASRSLSFGFTLPAGDYALVTEAYATGDGAAIGRPWAAFFTVTEPGETPTPVTVSPVLPTTTTTMPAATTPTPGPGGTPPPTQPPAGPTPTTTAPGGGTAPAPQLPPSPTTTTTGPAGAPAPAPKGPSPTTTTRPDGVTTPTTAPVAPPTTPPPAPTGPTTTTTGPSVTTTTTTSPAAAPPSVPLPPPADPETDGALTVTGFEPRYASTVGGERITVRGRGFRGTMHVLFGASPGTAASVVSDTSLLVTTPIQAAAGTVDVRVSTALDSVVLDDAFTFVAPEAAPPGGPTPTLPPVVTPPPGPPPATTTTTTAPPSTTPTTQPPAGTPPTTVPPSASTTTTVPATTPTTQPSVPTSTPRFTFGPVSATRGTLQLRTLTASSPLAAYPASAWPGRRCATATCAGTRL